MSEISEQPIHDGTDCFDHHVSMSGSMAAGADGGPPMAGPAYLRNRWRGETGFNRKH